MTPHDTLVKEVAALYQWLDAQVATLPLTGQGCTACGQCCDFAGYDHRLYVTSPEMIYFIHHAGPEGIRAMCAGRCPYNEENHCTAYGHRFAGCRIFQCRGNHERQSELSEAVSVQFKALCETYGIPYQYMDLATALKKAAGQAAQW